MRAKSDQFHLQKIHNNKKILKIFKRKSFDEFELF